MRGDRTAGSRARGACARRMQAVRRFPSPPIVRVWRGITPLVFTRPACPRAHVARRPHDSHARERPSAAKLRLGAKRSWLRPSLAERVQVLPTRVAHRRARTQLAVYYRTLIHLRNVGRLSSALRDVHLARVPPHIPQVCGAPNALRPAPYSVGWRPMVAAIACAAVRECVDVHDPSSPPRRCKDWRAPAATAALPIPQHAQRVVSADRV
eukprot:1343639-Pleurochrysis_carterae.AAC.7